MKVAVNKDPQVFTKKGSKRIHIVAQKHGENVNLVACAKKEYVIPPTIQFIGVRNNPAWEKNYLQGLRPR